ncbi:phage portal protein [Caloramator sp. CAR-1]|uniref:phage portal protein n=1 Tax=Caloramator sp. CAR-1 TaxID=3062777 RepID=UPI0026E379DB|nr:phage portal protein [Caloramator sp. CAR-1]MDO6355290.1 phage portal protein [Caloramator sp. CAR-1]
MNIVDKIIEYISPQTALKRERARAATHMIRNFINSGYSESGASRRKKSLAGWNAVSKSPYEDIDLNLDLLRQRSRDLYMSAPLAVSALKTNRTNIIGAGLKLKSRIDFEYLGLTKEEADEWERNAEREFEIWANSVFCDSTRLNNFYELQQLALLSWLMNGDAFALIKYDKPTSYMPYGLRIHLIEADRVSTPDNVIVNQGIVKAANGNKILNGIEIDNSGGVVAYYICNQYPNSTLLEFKKKWTRVEAFGERTGNPNILHIMESERCEQYRGVPYLAPVIESLKQITRYAEAELTAAVITGFFTVFIKTDNNTSEIPITSPIPDEEQLELDESSYELGAGTVNVLRPGEDVVIADPKRPSSNFDSFVNALAKYIGAALEIPYELLTKSFTASYSASRAALLEAWKAFKMRRTWFANDFCQPIYEIWLAEAVARGRISAPGFFNDIAIRKAWCGTEWTGPSPGQIDPVKEVEAAIKRIEQGLSTREKETTELTGGDWDKNIIQIQRENELLKRAMKGDEKSE